VADMFVVSASVPAVLVVPGRDVVGGAVAWMWCGLEPAGACG
jgi:hypothetical protein